MICINASINAVAGRPPIRPAGHVIGARDRWDHVLARWGVNRGGHRVEPGLYALGGPNPDSPVFVTANYTLSFDAVRQALAGIDGYLLVLDTRGVNVWCAAGKGTFGTDELVRRMEATALGEVVRHRVVILPQLGATGVAAHEVERRSGFEVEYGPVRASDLRQYLETRRATPAMRRVRFTLADRLTLIPVELVHALIPLAVASAGAYLLGGMLAAVGVATALLAGAVLFPILLPWLPTRDFSTKGFILGGLAAVPFILAALLAGPGPANPGPAGAPLAWPLRVGWAAAYLLALPSVTAYLALNFTGSTPFTSRTGVRREIFTYIPVMAWTFGAGVVLAVALALIQVLGGGS